MCRQAEFVSAPICKFRSVKSSVFLWECRGKYSEHHKMFWSIAAGVWYAVSQVKPSTTPLQQLMNTNLESSKKTKLLWP